MCFSAPVSFIAGASLSAIGGATLSQITDKKQIPFASIPLLFGIQQIIEGVVWLSFGTPWLNNAATHLYAFFAFILWPFFSPMAVLMLEKNLKRKKILTAFLGGGIAVSSYLLYWVIRDSVTSSIVQHSLTYCIPHINDYDPINLAIVYLYLVATIASCLISSHKKIFLFGIALALSCLSAYLISNITFYSTWCFFAALLSVIVFWHFNKSSLKKGGNHHPKNT